MCNCFSNSHHATVQDWKCGPEECIDDFSCPYLMVYTQRWMVLPYQTWKQSICILKDPETETAWQWLGWGMACIQSVGRQTEYKCDSSHVLPNTESFLWWMWSCSETSKGYVCESDCMTYTYSISRWTWKRLETPFLHLHHFSVLWFSIVPLTFEIYLGLRPVAWEGNGESGSEYP